MQQKNKTVLIKLLPITIAGSCKTHFTEPNKLNPQINVIIQKCKTQIYIVVPKNKLNAVFNFIQPVGNVSGLRLVFQASHVLYTWCESGEAVVSVSVLP